MKFAQLDNTRKILTWAHDNGLAVEEVDIVGYQARDDIKALTKYVAEKCSPRTLKLSCSCEDQPEWCHVDNCDTIIELIPILAAAGTTEFSLPAHGSDPVEHLALLAQRSKADLRYNGTLMIEFDMPTELQIAQFEAMPLEPWRDDNDLGKYARKGYLQLVHIYVWDDHDIETESPVSRAGRHYRSAAWMRYLAQQLIQFFGPLAQYDLRFMGSKEASTMRMSAVSQVHDEITHTSSRAYEMIFTNAIAEIIRTTRDSRTPGWRKVVKEAEQVSLSGTWSFNDVSAASDRTDRQQHSSVKFERWAELEFNNTPP
jgi:hypothetical protein